MLRSSSVSVCRACADCIARSWTLRNALAIVCSDRRRTTAPYFRDSSYSDRFLLGFFRHVFRSDLGELRRSGEQGRAVSHLRWFCLGCGIRRLVSVPRTHSSFT